MQKALILNVNKNFQLNWFLSQNETSLFSAYMCMKLCIS